MQGPISGFTIPGKYAHRENMEYLARTPRALTEAINRLRSAPLVAMDTEFFRVNVYRPRLCLVQLATEDIVVLVDVLGVGSLESLAAIFAEIERELILHSARGDLEVLSCSGLPVQATLFDTQLAASFCGHDWSLGYAQLVKLLLGIEIKKGATRSNWRRRPLSADQLRYAVSDVIHLPRIREILAEQLENTDHGRYFREDCSRLKDPGLWQVDPETAWTRVKSWRRLERRSLTRLQHLASVRERLGDELNRPVQWICDDRALLRWVENRERDIEDWQPPKLSGWEARSARERLAEALLDRADTELRPSPETLLPVPHESQRLDRVVEALRKMAAALDVPVELLGSRAMAKRLLRSRPKSRSELASQEGWAGWRDELCSDLLWPHLR